MVVLVVWTAACAVLLLLARRDLQQGVDRLEEARRELGPADLTGPRALDLLGRARREFDSADGFLGSPVLAPMRVVPVVGRQVRSAAALADAAREAVGLGTDAVDDAGALLDRLSGSGHDRVELAQRMAELAASTRTGLRDLDLGPTEGLIGPLRDARRRFAEERAELVGSLGDAETAGRGLAAFLEGPSRYLVLAANNAEMRAGSGMFLSAGVLTVRDGHLGLEDMRSTDDLRLPGEGVPLPDDLAARWGWLHPGREWRHLGVSPRFDVTGALAADMWAAGGRPPVDGVLALDVPALAAVLEVTGPIEVDGRPLDADAAVRELLHDQYEGVRYEDDQSQRRERLGIIAGLTVLRLDEAGADVADLAEALADAARGRHVLAWARTGPEAAGWRAAGIDGAMAPDSLLVSLLNFGGNKLDQFLDTSADLAVDRGSDGTDVTVRLSLANQVPDGEPPYIAGPHPDLDVAPGTYVGTVAATLPGSATRVRVEGAGRVVAEGPDGPTNVIAADVRIPPGGRVAVTVRFRLPPAVRALRVGSTARRPAVDWRGPDGAWRDTAPRLVTW